MEVETTLEQKIIELIKLNATEDIRNVSFSFPSINIKTRSLINIKCICKSIKYTGQLLISIIVPTGF